MAKNVRMDILANSNHTDEWKTPEQMSHEVYINIYDNDLNYEEIEAWCLETLESDFLLWDRTGHFSTKSDAILFKLSWVK